MVGFTMLKVLISPAGKDWVKRFALIREDNRWVVDFGMTKKSEIWEKSSFLEGCGLEQRPLGRLLNYL